MNMSLDKLSELEEKIKRLGDSVKLIEYGSYLIDGVIFRVKTQDARKWIEEFLVKYSEIFPMNVFIRMNPYRTLKILWMIHLRIALRGRSLSNFLELTELVDELDEVDLKTKFIEKGVRVIPLAPAWLPRNRVLIDFILEYISGRIEDEMAKKIFYSAFLKLFERDNIIHVKEISKWEPFDKDACIDQSINVSNDD